MVPARLQDRWLNGKPVREKYFKTNTYILNASAAPATVSERDVCALCEICEICEIGTHFATICQQATVSACECADGKAAYVIHEPVYRPVPMDGNAAGMRCA